MRQFSIYIHIPFCIQKCAYCDFLSAPAGEQTKKAYVEALLAEIDAWRACMREYEADTVFFGGGTPSCLNNGLLEFVLCKLKETFRFSADAEITVEVNPGTVDINKLESYRRAGVNRLSIGLQSPFEEDLKTLGRIHGYGDFMSVYEGARAVGFSNINVDMMSALPGQTVQRYVEGLRRVASLGPEHISAYSLIIEEGTPFYERYQAHEELLPDEEEEREMYERTEEVLTEYGYRRYEISNYAKSGFECRHNKVYWKGRDYLGLGLGAASKLSDVRFKGLDSLKEYMSFWGEKRVDGLHNPCCMPEKLAGFGAYQEIRRLSAEEQMEEFMFLGLRCMEGISAEAFREKFHLTLAQAYGKQIDRLEKLGLMERAAEEECKQDEIWRLTKRGIDVSNTVFVEFLH